MGDWDWGIGPGQYFDHPWSLLLIVPMVRMSSYVQIRARRCYIVTLSGPRPAFNEILWIFLSQDNRNISVVNFIIGPIGGIIKSPGWQVIVMQFIFTSSNSSLSVKNIKQLGSKLSKIFRTFWVWWMCDQVQGITLTRQLLQIALSDSLMKHGDKGDTSCSLNLMISQIPVVCCLKKCPCSQISFISDDTNSWHSWQWLSSPERVTHDTWQVRTQNIFPLISIIRIFSVCPSFPFFWLGVPRTKGCITRPSLRDSLMTSENSQEN